MIPDYTQQVQQTYRNMASQGEVTLEGWRDSVGQRFFEKYMDKYKEETDFYILGLNQTLINLEKCQNEMAQLCGVDMESGEKPPSVYDNEGNRNSWNENFDGPAPGNLDSPEVKRIMNERDRR